MIYKFNKLKPIKEIEPDYWQLEWKPIKNFTYNFYVNKTYKNFRRFGLKKGDSSAHNGWGRSWDGFYIRLSLYLFEINFWLHYNFICHKDGPLDHGKQKLTFNR